MKVGKCDRSGWPTSHDLDAALVMVWPEIDLSALDALDLSPLDKALDGLTLQDVTP